MIFSGLCEQFLNFSEKSPGALRRECSMPGNGSACCLCIETYLSGISPSERDLYDYVIGLRDVSTHALLVRPDRGDISVEVFDTRTRGGTIVGNLAYQHDYGCAGAENAIQSTKITIKYFFVEKPQDDVVALCDKVIKTVEAMVATAYAANP
jgi:hypothetical protein